MKKSLYAALLLLALNAHSEVTLKPEGERLQVLIDGKLFTEYRTDQAVPCLYPLVSASGSGVTRNYPLTEAAEGEEKDHPHHVSMWFTHGLVNGADFWHKGKQGKINHLSYGKQEAKGESASFTVNLAWEAGETVHLVEQRKYTIINQDKSRIVDVESTVAAGEGDATFGDTKEGSFAIRVAPTLRHKGKVAKGNIINSAGDKDGAAWGKRAAWVAYTGPDPSGEPTVITIFDHPSNLRHPTWWHARDYGLLGANPFGQHDFEKKKDKHLGDYTLPKGETMTFKYRVLIHHGDMESAKVNDVWKDFSGK